MSLGTADPSAEEHLPDDSLAETGEAKVEGRSLSQIAWARLRRDKVAIVSAVLILFVILVAIFAPVIATHDPNLPNTQLLNPGDSSPQGGWLNSGMSKDHWLGVEPLNGRDIFSRMVYGARVSLIVALGGTIVAMVLGTVIGMTAGYFRGWIDAVLGRFMDIMLSFPSLLFIIAITPVVVSVAESRFGMSDNNVLRIAIMIFVLGFFGWAYLARIVRGQTLSIREREFVESARAIGAGSGHVIFKQILPNLMPTLLVYATLTLPTNITAEAALSYLGVGVKDPTPSWGVMIATAANWYQNDPLFLFFPGAALLITVLAFNLLGDSVRDALDPRAGKG